jgi:alkylhydroperoxidase family enzyme
MNLLAPIVLSLATFFQADTPAEVPVITPRPVPATRPEMKELLEAMKKRPHRIPLPELSEEEAAELGERSGSYEGRLRFHYVPQAEGSVFGSGRSRSSQRSTASGSTPRPPAGSSPQPRPDFTRNADENMTLTYQFKTKLFWIVSRTNNCQYCLGHQEWKLSATGMTDDEIAALDADWSQHSEAEQAAFAYARLITWEPDRLSDDAISKVLKHYTPEQVLEMTMSMSGNNAINRWKEGTGIPQSEGNTFQGRGGSAPSHSDTFVTPTADKYRNAVSIVAPLEVFNGKATGKGLSRRARLESPEQVKVKLQEASARKARLPLADESTTAAWLTEAGFNEPVEHWQRLIAVFPNEGRGRLPSLISREMKTGDLTELQKSQLNWIIARQDRAWYAAGQAFQKLRDLGQSEQQIFALDGDWQEFSDADRAVFTFARHLAAAPIALTDEDVARALQLTSPRVVVQTINHVASCAYFDRVTEAAGLPLETPISF